MFKENKKIRKKKVKMMMMMMIKQKRDVNVKPLLLKFGVALALSFAGFLYSRIRNKRIKPSDDSPPPPTNSESDRKVDHEGRLRIKDDPQPEMDIIDSYNKPCIRIRADSLSMHTSPSGRYSEDKDGYLLPEFDQLVSDLDGSTDPKTDLNAFLFHKELPKTLYSINKEDYVYEIENLKRSVRFLREREKKLEFQLLEYHGLKEQETTVMELKNRLKINNVEAKLFSLRIESLQADNRRLAAQVADYSKVVSELEDARAKIKLLKRKIRHEAQHNKEQIFDLKQRVVQLREQEHEAGTSDSDAHYEMQRVADLEAEAEKLKNSNESLQQENAELARRLESTQFLASSLSEDPEKEELSRKMAHLREENEILTKDVDRLQADRCSDAEEVVYLRWLNACLRYKLRNYQPPPGETVARDLSKCLSPTSEKKAKQLILEYANTEDGEHREPSLIDFDFYHWPSSQPSYLTDSTEHDDSPGHGSDTKRHHKKLKIFTKLRRLITGKHSHHHHSRSGQVSPLYRSHSVDDFGRRCASVSPRGTRCYEGGTDESPQLASSSQNSNNSSLEYQPLSRLDEEDGKDTEDTHTMSDFRRSPGGVRFVLGSKSSSSSPFKYRLEHDSEDSQKSELARFAEVLRDSKPLQRMHRKSASVV